MTDQIICYGTVWVTPSHLPQVPPSDALPSPETLHVTSPRLDTSFLMNFFLHSIGKTWEELRTSARTQTPIEPGDPLFNRIGGSPHTSARTYHLYEYTDRFCRSLSVLTAERIREIADNWRAIYGAATATAIPEPSPYRMEVLTRLVELARAAVDNGATLRLRVDYRRKTEKP